MAFSTHAQTTALLALIAAHRHAWIALAQAEPEHRTDADRRQRAALLALLEAPCATRADAEVLRPHLCAVLAADRYGLGLGPLFPAVDAHARALACMLDRRAPAAPVRLGDAVLMVLRSLGLLGEAAAALVLVAGGAVLVGYASLL